MKLVKKINANPKYVVELTDLEARALAIVLGATTPYSAAEHAVRDHSAPGLATVLRREQTTHKLYNEFLNLVGGREATSVPDIVFDPEG